MSHAYKCDGCGEVFTSYPALTCQLPNTAYEGIRKRDPWERFARFQQASYTSQFCRPCAAMIVDTLANLPYAESHERWNEHQPDEGR